MVDAIEGEELFRLDANATYSVTDLPEEWSITCDTFPAVVGSVRLHLNGRAVKMENFIPYSLGGENIEGMKEERLTFAPDGPKVFFKDTKLIPGVWTIGCRPYSEKNAN